MLQQHFVAIDIVFSSKTRRGWLRNNAFHKRTLLKEESFPAIHHTECIIVRKERYPCLKLKRKTITFLCSYNEGNTFNLWLWRHGHIKCPKSLKRRTCSWKLPPIATNMVWFWIKEGIWFGWDSRQVHLCTSFHIFQLTTSRIVTQRNQVAFLLHSSLLNVCWVNSSNAWNSTLTNSPFKA